MTLPNKFALGIVGAFVLVIAGLLVGRPRSRASA